MPPAVFSSASSGSTTMRSSRGLTLSSFSLAILQFPFEMISDPGERAFVVPSPSPPRLHVHPTHPAHAPHSPHAPHTSHASPHPAMMLVMVIAARFLFLRNVCDKGFSG